MAVHDWLATRNALQERQRSGAQDDRLPPPIYLMTLMNLRTLKLIAMLVALTLNCQCYGLTEEQRQALLRQRAFFEQEGQATEGWQGPGYGYEDERQDFRRMRRGY